MRHLPFVGLVLCLSACGSKTPVNEFPGGGAGGGMSGSGGGDASTGGGSAGGTGGGMGGGSGGGSSAGGGTTQMGSHADGTLETWTSVQALPVARANHCAVAFGDYLIVAGGNYKPSGSPDFITLDDVVVGHVGTDGDITQWVSAGTLPGPAIDCVLAVDGHTLMLLGGLFGDTSMDQNVWTTTLTADGHLGTWTLVGTLPYGRRALGTGAKLNASSVYITDSRLPSEGIADSVLATASFTNQHVGTWYKTSYAADFRGAPQGAFTDDAAWITGGYGGPNDAGVNAVLTDVVAVPLNGTTPRTTTPLPEPRTFGAAVYVDGYLFVLGGRTEVFAVNPLATVISAPITGLDAGTWSTQRPMPAARSNLTATVVGDWLFVVGGGNSGPGLDTVYRTRVKHAAPQ